MDTSLLIDHFIQTDVEEKTKTEPLESESQDVIINNTDAVEEGEVVNEEGNFFVRQSQCSHIFRLVSRITTIDYSSKRRRTDGRRLSYATQERTTGQNRRSYR